MNLPGLVNSFNKKNGRAQQRSKKGQKGNAHLDDVFGGGKAAFHIQGKRDALGGVKDSTLVQWEDSPLPPISFTLPSNAEQLWRLARCEVYEGVRLDGKRCPREDANPYAKGKKKRKGEKKTFQCMLCLIPLSSLETMMSHKQGAKRTRKVIACCRRSPVP